MIFRDQLRLILRSRGRYFRRRTLAPPFPMQYGGRACELAGAGAGAAAAYWEVYVEDFYGLRKMAANDQAATIVDIGANAGFFSCFARLRFPSAKIVAYEPNPEAFRHLEFNTRKRNIEIHCAAVGKEDGVASFDVGPDSTLGHLTAGGGLQVRVVGTRGLAGGSPIDLLKLDCEGGEWEILTDREMLARTRWIVMEYHLIGGKTWDDLTALLTAGGHCVHRCTRNETPFGFLQSDRCGESRTRGNHG